MLVDRIFSFNCKNNGSILSLISLIKQMSEFGQSSHQPSAFQQPISARSKFQAEESASQLIQSLIERVIHRVERAQRFRLNILRFSEMKTLKNINEVSSLHFLHSKEQPPRLPLSGQPVPLYVDSLLAISADIDKPNDFKLGFNKKDSGQMSQITKGRRSLPNKAENNEKYLKLQGGSGDEQEDGYTKQLRRIQEERQAKENNEQRLKEKLAQEEQEKMNQKKKQRQERLSFDYAGLPLKIRSESKTNLISKVLNGSIYPKTLVDKQALNDPNPQMVDSVVLGMKKNKAIAIKKRDEVQFRESRSLSEGLTVVLGVRYNQEGRTLQLKKKLVSTIQLKKTLSTRRLSKEEFQRLRSLNGSHFHLEASETSFRQTKHKRSQSEAKFQKNSPQIQREKITINNPNLHEKLLEKVNQMLQPPKIENNPQGRYEYVGKIDIFNINYLKNGHPKNDKNVQTLSTQRSLLSLPKIGRSEPSKQNFPKQRERIKEINTVIYEIRKKFDQKLQY